MKVPGSYGGIPNVGHVSNVPPRLLARWKRAPPNPLEIMRRKAVFLDRDGVINEDSGWIRRSEDLVVFPFAARAIRQLNERGWLIIVVSNQSAVARELCTHDEIERIHQELQNQVAREGARIDAFYYCPHHPDFGTVRDCDCRKPKTGMIDRAVERFGIDRDPSYLIGDKTSDLLAGKRAGLKTILVRTGEGGRDQACDAIPDVTVADLAEAVKWILAEDREQDRADE